MISLSHAHRCCLPSLVERRWKRVGCLVTACYNISWASIRISTSATAWGLYKSRWMELSISLRFCQHFYSKCGKILVRLCSILRYHFRFLKTAFKPCWASALGMVLLNNLLPEVAWSCWNTCSPNPTSCLTLRLSQSLTFGDVHGDFFPLNTHASSLMPAVSKVVCQLALEAVVQEIEETKKAFLGL